ncbi:metalloregulator ArsR/SmtB family transcription factor [Leptospira sp. 96542]|nr:metalloregulator ArsR/SmtB family transcription factor [Leptospira sp. 96542]
MANNKKTEFPKEDQLVSEFTKLLAHPARLIILKVLAERRSCVCGEIVEVLPLAQATVSQHLKELKLGGLIKGEIEGNLSCYCIDWENLERAKSELDFYFSQLINLRSDKKENCC